MRITGFQLLRFFAVGMTSTVTTLIVLVGLVELVNFKPVLASVLGYALGALVNYFLNYHITFVSSARHSVALPRFILVVFSGLIINTFIMYFAVDVYTTPYFIGQLIAVGFVMTFSFIAYKCWAFVE